MSAEYLEAMISKYGGKGAIIDSNLLLLYFVGLYDPEQIQRFKRTRTYTVEDFILLASLLSWFNRLVTTPNILTEVSNLSGQLREPIKSSYFQEFKKQVRLLHERYRPSRMVCRNPHFQRFGLTDSAIVDLSKKKYLVLTDDLRLWGLLQKMEIDAINFNQIRPFGWSSRQGAHANRRGGDRSAGAFLNVRPKSKLKRLRPLFCAS